MHLSTCHSLFCQKMTKRSLFLPALANSSRGVKHRRRFKDTASAVMAIYLLTQPQLDEEPSAHTRGHELQFKHICCQNFLHGTHTVPFKDFWQYFLLAARVIPPFPLEGNVTSMVSEIKPGQTPKICSVLALAHQKTPSRFSFCSWYTKVCPSLHEGLHST